MSNRLIIIGLDGAPYSLIKDLAPDLAGKYTFISTNSTIPEVSSVAWSSIITGASPAAHGTFGFTDRVPGTYRIYFPQFTDLKVKPFWKEREDLNYHIINVPSTYPAQPLNGTLISGFVSYKMEEAIYPSSLLGYLEEIGYRIDADSQKAHTSIDEFTLDLDKTLQARIRLFNKLWDERGDVFMFVFTETDRLFHFLWVAYQDQNHKYHAYFLDFLRRIKEVIADKLRELAEGDDLIILSDHGFESLEKDVMINNLLKERGFLEKSAKLENMELMITDKTRAFSLDPARIYFNTDEDLTEELKSLFLSWEIEGRKVIARILPADDIYKGPYRKYSPDLVLVANKGFNLKSSLKGDKLYTDGSPFTGKHTHQGAFLITNIEGKFSDDCSVIDIGRMIKDRIKTL